MFKIDTVGSVNGAFVEENPATGQQPTIVSADWLNAYQSELIAVLEAAGISPSKANNAQLLAAINALIESRVGDYVVAGGTANAITAVLVPATTSSNANTSFRFKAPATNTAGVTLDAGGGAKPLVREDGTPMQAGDILAGMVVSVVYDVASTSFRSTEMVTSQVAGQIALAAQTQANTACTTEGTAPAFTTSPTPALSALNANVRLRVKFHAASTGSDTLNVSGFGAKSIKQYDSTGAKVAAVIAAGQLADVEYDGTDFVLLDALPMGASVKQIQPITASVAANALTLTLNPTTLDFRSATRSSGTVNTRTVANAISLVVPQFADLGTIGAQSARLAVIALDVAGTVELAVANLSGAPMLNETQLISTTAISTYAQANSIIYSTDARTNVPYRVVGFIEITQQGAGVWNTAPSTIQGAGGQALAAMSSIGFWQTSQNVMASRELNTTYYNMTGKPIFLQISVHSSANVGCRLHIDGAASFFGHTTTTGGGAYYSAVYGIIPPGGSYRCESTAVLQAWYELR